MPPVDRWTIFYADGSTFTSADGTWAEAPPFAVFCVVYYLTDGCRVFDRQQHDDSVYRYLPEVDGAVDVEGTCVGGVPVKFGLWVSNAQYFKLFDASLGEVRP